MAVKALKWGVVSTRRAAEMSDAIAAEIKRSVRSPKPPDTPEIYWEKSLSGRKDYYVVWDRFRAIPQDARTGIILNGLIAAFGKKRTLDTLTIALGLTRDEAENMGFNLR